MFKTIIDFIAFLCGFVFGAVIWIVTILIVGGIITLIFPAFTGFFFSLLGIGLIIITLAHLLKYVVKVVSPEQHKKMYED